MDNPLGLLPTELLFRITDRLCFSDKLPLSSTSHALRAIFAPVLFRTLKVDVQNEESSNVVYGLLAKYRKHVRQLRFECHTGPMYHDDGETSEPEFDAEDEQQMAGEKKRRESSMAAWRMARDLLDGKLSPSIKEMTLCFYCAPEPEPCDPDEVPTLKHSKNPYWVQRFNQFWDVESEDDVKAAEDTDYWRFLLRSIWDAIALNTTVRKLTVHNLIPKRATSFDLPEFREFLGQLEELDLTLLGMESWASTTAQGGYMDFMGSLNVDIFNHLNSVKNVRLIASEYGPLGLSDSHQGRHVPLPLNPDHMQRLQQLELENCFVGRELVNFLTSHASTITSLKLAHCRCTSPEIRGSLATAESRIYWADLFTAMRKSKDIRLSKLVIVPRRVSLTSDETYDMTFNVDEAEESDEIRSARARLREEPRLRLFAYGSVTDDRYGTWYKDAEDVFESFQSGRDQSEYDKLVKVVARNASQMPANGRSKVVNDANRGQ